MRKIIYRKTDHSAKWCNDTESVEGFTDQEPPMLPCDFDDDLGVWVPRTVFVSLDEFNEVGESDEDQMFTNSNGALNLFEYLVEQGVY